MDTQYFCKNKLRRNAVKNPKDAWGNLIKPVINGIDYLEVVSIDQKTLEVHFLHNLPGQTNPVPPSPAPKLKKENIIINGGIRIKNIQVDDVSDDTNILTVTVNEAGDFSIYTLRIVQSPTTTVPPTGFDPQLSKVNFSFKVNCPSDFDCKEATVCPTEKLTNPRIDYLAKDYASLRRLMLDRLSNIMPDWKERNAADLQIALVELLAYAGDHLSYYQDAVATEAYLDTARRRISAKRHARLLDYFAHDGCNARTWVFVKVKEEGSNPVSLDLPENTILMTKGNGNITINKNEMAAIIDQQKSVIFETKHRQTLYRSHNEIHFYTWGDTECCLSRGSIKATLRNDPQLFLESEMIEKKEFPVLIFEEIRSPTNGNEADADPNHRHAVRLKKVESKVDKLNNIPVIDIEWFEEDALPFSLCITALVRNKNGKPEKKEISIARGNIVLADHGITLDNQELIPKTADKGDYFPLLKHTGITVTEDYRHEIAKTIAASLTLRQNPHNSLPVVLLQEGTENWTAKQDLLGSDRFATEFVTEIESDSSVRIRFGDNILGRKPSTGFTPLVTYRIGNGRSGNIGRDTITCIVWKADGIESVRNPLPAVGGQNPETIEEIKQFAPFAFRTQERAVTEEDYAEKTELHQEVQKAAARFRWTGSWFTVFVTVDRKGGLDVDLDFKKKIIRHLEKYRMAGYDLEIEGPIFVPLDIIVNVCVKPDYFRSNVKERLFQVFSSYDLADGSRGFFHPDNFTCGQPVYLSAVYQRVMQVAGVASVEVKKFQRWAKKANYEKENGLLQPAELEIIRLDNDPNFPENGKIDFLMYGGL